MDEKKWIEKLKGEGIESRVCSMEPNFNPGEHTHDEHTVHVILKGELTIINQEGKKVYKPGDRVDFPAGTTHSAAFGSNGCTMIVGVKEKADQ
jgi:quercetin dioxygenase-like cupin family protein